MNIESKNVETSIPEKKLAEIVPKEIIFIGLYSLPSTLQFFSQNCVLTQKPDLAQDGFVLT